MRMISLVWLKKEKKKKIENYLSLYKSDASKSQVKVATKNCEKLKTFNRPLILWRFL